MDWFHQYDWLMGLIYTLTFPPFIAERRMLMERQLRHFWNRIDLRLYGNLSRKKRPYRCVRINLLEPGANAANHHVHGLVGLPLCKKAGIELSNSEALINVMDETWRMDMDFNTGRSPLPYDIAGANNEGYADEEWVSYITKTITNRNTDAICLETSWFYDGQEPLTI